MIMSAFYNTILRQREHSNKWPTTFRLLDMNCTSKAKFTANSADFYQTCYFQLPVTPPPSFHHHTAATHLHGNPGRSVPWEREWAELTSVWTLACGQCQHTNMAHSILPYGAIAYVLQARPQEWGPDVRCWSEGDKSTPGPVQNLIHGQNGTESDVRAAKWKHNFLHSHTCLFPVM